jgi:hypothetical protein
MQLQSAMNEFGWPSCLCQKHCACDRATAPEWANSFGRIHPILRCLDIEDEDFLFSDEFLWGIQRVQTLSTKRDAAAELIVNIAFNDTLETFSHKKILDKEKQIAYIVRMDGLDLRYFASGCTCGRVIQDMFIRWNFLQFHCKSESSRKQELAEWSVELQKIIKKIDLAQQWLVLSASRNQFQSQYEIWNGAMFWRLQHALFLIEDIRLLSTTSFDQSFKRFNSGLLLWQVGWMQTDKKICKEICNIFFSNNNYV